MTRHADGRYNKRAWTPGVSPPPVEPQYAYLGPWASNEERLTQQALRAAEIPGAELVDFARCPLPQVELFAPRFGYRTRQPGLLDVVNVNRDNNNPRISWFSGSPAGYSGTLRNVEGS